MCFSVNKTTNHQFNNQTWSQQPFDCRYQCRRQSKRSEGALAERGGGAPK